MPFPRSTLAALRAQAQSDLGAPSLLRFSNLRVLADVLAKGVNGLYGYLDWIAREAVPFTATDEHLEAWAALKGVIRKPAAPAAGAATLVGTPNTVVPQGAVLVRPDGVGFATQAVSQIGAGGTLSVTVVAVDPGSAGNTDAGVTLAPSIAIAGIASGMAANGLSGGAEVETDDQLRTRMLLAYSQPPQGGSLADYLGWTEAVTGVTRAWIAPAGMGPGSVVAFFMMDGAQAAHGGFPQGSDGVAAAESRDVKATGDQLAVANYLFARCNVTTLVFAVAPKPNAVDFIITGLAAAPAATQAAARAAIDAVFVAKGSPGGVRLVNGSVGGVVQMSDVNAAINAVAGATGFVITGVSAAHGSASPTTNITSQAGYLPVRGAVSFL